MDSTLKAALYYAKLGLRVFPVHSMRDGACSCGGQPKCRPGKHPRVNHWPNSATTDENQIRRWWTQWPDANIGIATGPESGVWVLDLDGPKGIADLAAMEAQNGPVPKTVSAATGGGGRHLYFKYPKDIRVGSGSKKRSGKAIDFRGAGGYIIAPPSNHHSGRSYDWETPPGVLAFAEAPEWVITFVNVPIKSISNINVDDSDALLMELAGPDLRTDQGVPEGGRHETAKRLIASHLGRGDRPHLVLKWLNEWAGRCTPPMDLDEAFDLWFYFVEKEEDKLDDTPVAQDVPPPVLDEAAFHGLAGEIVKAIEPHTESDPAGLLIQLLTYFGNVVGRGPFFMVEATKHHTNLFTVLVGETARGRKGTSEGRVRELFVTIDPFWVQNCIRSGLSSGEGLIWSVRDPIGGDKEGDSHE